MTAPHRLVPRTCTVLAALVAAAAPALAQRGAPDPSTPRVLVATFRSADRGLGVTSADALRERVAQDFNIRQLLAVSKQSIIEALKGSGFNPDSALSSNDARELARMLRADQIVDGEVTRLADGSVKVTSRMLLPRDVALSQPLGEVTAKNVNDAAKLIARELSEALKQLRDAQDCENAVRAQRYDAAVAAARKAIAVYPKATIARLCLASAQAYAKAPADEVIRTTDEVLALDSLNRIALGLKHAAQEEKGDVEGAIATLLRMVAANPTDRSLIEAVVAKLAQTAPERAVEIMGKLVADVPDDPSLTRQYWLVLLRAGRFAQALGVGETLARLDSAQMDSTWFTRMTAAASAAGDTAKALAFSSRAVERLPRSAGFLALQAQLLRKTGQGAQAVAALQRAVAIDPKLDNGYVGVVVGFAELNQPDSARAWARQALVAGADTAPIGTALMGTVWPALQRAQASKTRADWRTALDLALAADSVASTSNSAYYSGVAAFQVGLDALQGLDRTRSCADVRTVEEMFALAQPQVMKGGKVDPATAAKILGVLGQMAPNVAAARQTYCPRNRE